MKYAVRLLVLLLSLTFLWGCALAWIGVGAGAGVGGMKYVEGKVVKQYPLEFERAWDATNTALANLGISITGILNEEVTGDIEGVRRDGVKVYISVKDMGQKVTSIAIRVGTFGDRETAKKIHDEIAAVAGL